MKIVEERLLFVSSADRTIGTVSNFNIIVPSDILATKSNTHQIKLTLVDFIAKKNVPNIVSYNNQMVVVETQGGIPITIQMNIPIQNYNITQLVSTLQTTLNTNSSYYTYTLSYNDQTGIISFLASTKTTNPVQSISFQFIQNSSQDSLAEAMGFYSNTTNNFTLASGNLNLSSSISVSLSGQELWYLRTNFYSNNWEKDYTNSSQQNYHKSNILSKIGIVVPFQDTIYFINNNSSTYSIMITPNRNLTTINFQLTNKNGKLIQLYHDYYMTLLISILDEEETKIESILNDNNNMLKYMFLANEKK